MNEIPLLTFGWEVDQEVAAGERDSGVRSQGSEAYLVEEGVVELVRV